MDRIQIVVWLINIINPLKEMRSFKNKGKLLKR